MRCSDIMKRQVECVARADTIQTAARKLRESNIGFLPVCDDATKVIGTITDRDIVIRVVADGLPVTTLIEFAMTNEVVACHPEDDLSKAERLMAEHQKSRIMCVDQQGNLVGVISLSDIAQYEKGKRAADTLRKISEREARAVPM